MKIENTQVFGFESAIRGMRNPLDSWDKSDSVTKNFAILNTENKNFNIEGFILGNADMQLSQKLTKAGTEHCKHLRMIQVWVDLILPRYIWTEFDTYRNLEKISCSTMHTLMKKPISHDMFEDGEIFLNDDVINILNKIIEKYKNADNSQIKKEYKYYAKSILPESFLQRRTINTNYMTLLNIYRQRKNHELPQWHIICDWIEKLPYFIELTGIEVKENKNT